MAPTNSEMSARLRHAWAWMINGFGIRGVAYDGNLYHLFFLQGSSRSGQPRKSPGQRIIGGRPVLAFTCHPHEMT